MDSAAHRNRQRFAKGLRDDIRNDLAVDVGQPEITPRVAVGQALVVEAHQSQQRRVQVVHVDGVIDGLEAELVGRAVDVAGLSLRRLQAPC